MHIFFYPNRKFNECSDVFLGCASPAGSSEFMGKTFQAAQLMPSPSASSKFVLSVLKFLGYTHKGQLVSKANCQAKDSSKKRTNEVVQRP